MIGFQLMPLHWGQIERNLNIRGGAVAVGSPRRLGAQTTSRRSVAQARIRRIKGGTPKRNL